MGDRRRTAKGHHTGKHAPARTPVPQRSNKKPQSATPRQVRNICVYCGSNPGSDPAYAAAARELGGYMAEAGIGLVYGGGGLGLMGEIARAVLAGGGRVTGIIPSFLSEREQMLRDVTELVVVADMHERKRLMFERSDAFVAMPGGIGTLEELVEQLTWAQLGRHSKPIVLLNVGGFWAPFTTLLDHMRREAFIRNSMDVSFRVADSPRAVLDAVHAAAAPAQPLAEAAVAEKF
jgi:uncharacterized protein (TIGR00730 family)